MCHAHRWRIGSAGRRLLVDRIGSGRPVAHVAAEMGVARQTAYRWWRRFVTEGDAGLRDPHLPPAAQPDTDSPVRSSGASSGSADG